MLVIVVLRVVAKTIVAAVLDVLAVVAIAMFVALATVVAVAADDLSIAVAAGRNRVAVDVALDLVELIDMIVPALVVAARH